jgi:hypothetical protein
MSYNYNNMAVNFQILQMFLNNQMTLNYVNNENKQENREALEHFRNQYYTQATFSKHYDYITNLVEYKKHHGVFPSENEFILMCRNLCLCPYYLEDNDYVRAAKFFIRNSDEYIGNIPCDRFYYLHQYYIIEQTVPSSIDEFLRFFRRSVLFQVNPSILDEDIIPRPVNSSVVETLKKNIFERDETDKEENCSICQDKLSTGQKCIKLNCGHIYHADKEECCESGSIFKWFEENRICPVCRKEVI